MSLWGKCYGEKSRLQVGETFSDGRESVTDEERSEQPSTSMTEENTVKIHQIMRENRWLTVMSIA